jgi:hypothetical protein
MMAGLGMSAVGSSVKLPGKNHPGSNTSTDSDIDKARRPFAGAPSRFGESRRIRVVLDGYGNTALVCKVVHEVESFPARQQVDIAHLAAERINRSGATDPDAVRGVAGSLFEKTEFFAYATYGVERRKRSCGPLNAREDTPVVLDRAYGDLASANVDRSNHADLLCRSRHRNCLDTKSVKGIFFFRQALA